MFYFIFLYGRYPCQQRGVGAGLGNLCKNPLRTRMFGWKSDRRQAASGVFTTTRICSTTFLIRFTGHESARGLPAGNGETKAALRNMEGGIACREIGSQQHGENGERIVASKLRFILTKSDQAMAEISFSNQPK